MGKILFGLLISGISFVTSTFKNQEYSYNLYVQNADGTYYRLINMTNTSYAFCQSSQEICMFIQTTKENLGNSLTAEQVQSYSIPSLGKTKLRPLIDPITGKPVLGIYVD